MAFLRVPFHSASLIGYEYCPLVKQLKSRRSEKWMGFGFSVAVHLAILLLAGIVFIKPVQFAVDPGLSGVEVELVAGSDEVIPVVQEVQPVIPAKAVPQESIPQEIVEPPPEQIVPQQKAEQLGNSTINASSTGQGAITEAKPMYLRNPAPRYPLKARQNGWEGTVLVEAAVDAHGYPTRVDIKNTSGYSVLDEAALKAVKAWVFEPARLGYMPVESSVQVPIRFDLKDQR